MKIISNLKKAKVVHKQAKILELCKDKSVLDVGCIGQDLNPSEKNWLHAKIKSVASNITGTDINTKSIHHLKAEGWNIVHPDELNIDNSTKYDVIVMGDVIEHVNDPGEFLTFYNQFLNDDGIIIVCTPNAFGIRYFLQVLFFGKPGTNPEHTLFLDPMVMCELVSRINLTPKEFFWLYEYTPPKSFPQKIIRAISSCFIFFRSYFRANFMIVLSKK